MLLKPFTNILKENKRREEKSYLGSVESNSDEDKLGRIRVRIPLYDDLNTEDIPYAYPILSMFLGNSPNSIAFSVPEIGSQVRVIFPTGNKLAPFYTGAELNSSNKCTFFDDDYPESYGIKDSKGNFVKINKKTGTTILQHSSTTNIEIVENGAYTVTDPSGSSFYCDGNGNYTMDGKTLDIVMSGDISMSANALKIITEKNVTIDTAVISAKASGFIAFKAPVVTADGNFGTTVGETGSFPALDGSQVTVTQGIIQNIGE